MKETKVYGLHAKGYNAVFDGVFKSLSKRIFTDKEGAEKHISEFIELCCDEKTLNYADRKGLVITVVEYILCGRTNYE